MIEGGLFPRTERTAPPSETVAGDLDRPLCFSQEDGVEKSGEEGEEVFEREGSSKEVFDPKGDKRRRVVRVLMAFSEWKTPNFLAFCFSHFF